MKDIFKSLESKLNRFISYLATKKDPQLNKFFKEVVIEVQDALNYKSKNISDNELIEFEISLLRDKIKKQAKVLDLFSSIKVEDLGDNEIERLNILRGGKYYSAKSFNDDINMIRDIDCYMKMFYPTKTQRPSTREQLILANTNLTKKLCKLIYLN